MHVNGNGETTRRRRERPAQPALTRRGIIDVALSILQNEGLSKVTVRRIAAALDTGPASLYVYVRSTEDLHAQMLDALLGSLATAMPADGTWKERLIAALTQYMRTLFRYPEMARLTLFNWPTGPNYLAFVDLLLALLREGGVGDREAAWGVDLLLQFVTATATEQGARKVSPRAAEEMEALTNVFAKADALVYPQIARLSDELVSGDGATRFAWGLDVLITGIFATRRPPTQQEEL